MGCYWNALSRYRLCQGGLELGFGHVLFIFLIENWNGYLVCTQYMYRHVISYARHYQFLKNNCTWLSSMWRIRVFWEQAVHKFLLGLLDHENEAAGLFATSVGIWLQVGKV